MARKTFDVTLISHEGPHMNLAATVTRAELIAALVGGPSILDGEVAPTRWADAVCGTCGDVAVWCPDMTRALPRSFVDDRRAALMA